MCFSFEFLSIMHTKNKNCFFFCLFHCTPMAAVVKNHFEENCTRKLWLDSQTIDYFFLCTKMQQRVQCKSVDFFFYVLFFLIFWFFVVQRRDQLTAMKDKLFTLSKSTKKKKSSQSRLLCSQPFIYTAINRKAF